MKLYIALGIGLAGVEAGCGGAPFELATSVDDASNVDSETLLIADASTDKMTIDAADAAVSDVRLTMANDASFESSTRDAAVIDSSSDSPPEGSTCTPFPAGGNCGGWAVPKYVLGPACDTIVSSTPPECARCRETYNCACLAAHTAAICGTSTAVLACVDGPIPEVTCR